MVPKISSLLWCLVCYRCSHLCRDLTVGCFFLQGMQDDQLRRLTDEVLKKRRIWALNIGENFNISLEAWQRFTTALSETSVAFMYVSEHHLMRTDLKIQMKDAIRRNRRYALL